MMGRVGAGQRDTGLGQSITPSAVLPPDALYALYVGGLSFPDRKQRLRASAVILLGGRLGLRPGEIQHLHEGWIDWGAGELRIPDRDPCACDHCWETARVLQRAGDGRRLAEIVTETMWTPSGGGRTIPFGWSQRLTGLLAAICSAEGYLDVSVESMTRLLAQSARRAEGLDHTEVDFCTLRSTAAAFFADTGVSTPRLADLVGEDVDRIRPFVSHEGGDLREQLYRQFADPAEIELQETYALVVDPAPFDAEPFDPPTFDAEWRHTRSRKRASAPDRLQNPRPVSDAVDSSFDTDSMGTRTYLDADSSLVDTEAGSSQLGRWVENREKNRRSTHEATNGDGGATTNSTQTASANADRTQQASASSDQSTPTSTQQPAEPAGPTDRAKEATGQQAQVSDTTDEIANPRELLSESAIISTNTTVACSEIASGQPVECRVLLGPEKLVVVRDDDSMSNAYAEIELSTVVDQSVNHIPDRCAEAIESAVTVAYNEGDGRKIAVMELAGNEKRNMSGTLFELILDDGTVVVTHPAAEGGHVTDKEPTEGTLTIRSSSLSVSPETGDGFTIGLPGVMDVDISKQRLDGNRVRSLSIQHSGDVAPVVTTKIGAPDDRQHKLLTRYVKQRYRERKKKVKQLTLNEEQKEVLVALFSVGDQIDISMVIDKDTQELQQIISSLRKMNLVRMKDGSTVLTGLGNVVVNEKIEDVNM